MSYAQPSVILRGTLQEDYRFLLSHVHHYMGTQEALGEVRQKMGAEAITKAHTEIQYVL